MFFLFLQYLLFFVCLALCQYILFIGVLCRNLHIYRRSHGCIPPLFNILPRSARTPQGLRSAGSAARQSRGESIQFAAMPAFRLHCTEVGSVFFLLAEDNNACARNDRCNTNADEAHCAGYRRIGSVGGNCGGFIGDAGLIGDDGLAADYD